MNRVIILNNQRFPTPYAPEGYGRVRIIDKFMAKSMAVLKCIVLT